MKNYISKDRNGTKMVNFNITPNGKINKIELNSNCVLVHLFKDYDDEGNLNFRKVVTLSVVDKEMEEPLRKEAMRIIYG